MLELVPISYSEACEFVDKYHRHNPSPQGHKFSIGCAEDGEVVGVCMVGRPVARHLDDGWTVEVIRCCTDGTKNANSKLYAAAWRVARNLGYRKLITYVGKDESGTTMEALQWKCVGEVEARSWHCKSRPRVDKHTIQARLRFEIAI